MEKPNQLPGQKWLVVDFPLRTMVTDGKNHRIQWLTIEEQDYSQTF